MTPKPWTVEASRHLLRDQWLSVRADDCRTESGQPIAPYYVLEYPDWAHVAAFNDDGLLLIIRQYRHALGRICAELPGGIIDHGETPLQAIGRELAEETGHGSDDWQQISALSPNPATHTNTVHGFLARQVRALGPPAPEATEHITHEFAPIADVMEMIATGEFAQSLQVATLLLALRRLDNL